MRFALALALAAAGLGAVGLLDTGDSATFITLFPFVLIAAFWLGPAPAALCALVGAAGALLFFVEPSFSIHLDSREDALRLTAFLISALLVAVATARLQRSEQAARESRALLETFVDRSPFGLGFFDADLRPTHVNDAMGTILVGPARPAVYAALQRVMQTRRALLDEHIESHGRTYRASYYPVTAEGGRLVGAGVSLEDVSERARADQGLRLLAETGALLESPLRADDRLELLARLLVPRYADAAVIVTTERHTLRTAAVAHRTPAAEADLRAAPPEPRLEHVARSGQLDWTAERITVPLVARGRVLGAMSIHRDNASFDESDIVLLEELAARAALALDTARLLAHQTRIAHSLQESLLPPHLPAIPGIDLAARYRAGAEGTEVGGDFYDAFATSTGWTVSIGDVCGKGAEAAAVTALARHTIRALAHEAESPASVLNGLNERLIASSGDPSHMTAAIVRFSPTADGAQVTASAAGHPLPLIVGADGRVEELGRPGTLLGPFAGEARFVDATVTLAPGDALVLYTDGVTEARSEGRLFGDGRLRETLAGVAGSDAHAIADAIESAVLRFGGRPADDMAIVVASVVGVPVQAPTFDQ
jgi:serine phosphatase RsbU (regulator of sigma subunit)/PAS domain-containing protein